MATLPDPAGPCRTLPDPAGPCRTLPDTAEPRRPRPDTADPARHHLEFEYSEAIRRWNQGWQPGGIFDRECPDVALLLVLTAGLPGPEQIFPALTEGTDPAFTGIAADVHRGFKAPFLGMADEAHNGLRRFPRSIPLDSYDNGNGVAQTHNYHPLLERWFPAHFIWGCTDDVFTESWGRTWAEQMHGRSTRSPPVTSCRTHMGERSSTSSCGASP